MEAKDDILSIPDLFGLIEEAKEEALRKGIKANVIIINKNLGYIPPSGMSMSGMNIVYPPMICGMNFAIDEKELPKNVKFVLTENKNLPYKQTTFSELQEENSELKEKIAKYEELFGKADDIMKGVESDEGD